MVRKHSATNSERGAMPCPLRWLLRYGLGVVPAKWLFRYGLGVVPAKEAEPLYVGSLWHDVMERYWGNCDESERYFTAFCWFNAEMARRREAMFFGGDDGFDKTHELLGAMLGIYHATELHRPPEQKWTVLGVEEVFEVPTTTPSGSPSPVSWYTGKVDLPVIINGDFYIGEHKTTSLDLDRWRAYQEYSPQAATYAILAEPKYGLAKGVAYDVIRKAYPPTPDKFPVKKRGGLSKKLPAEATVDGFRAAVQLSLNRGEAPEPWYGQMERKLAARDTVNRFCQRVVVRFEPGELDRARMELYAVATQLRSWHAVVGRRWDWVRRSHFDLFRMQAVCKVLYELQDRFPRSPSQCFRYGRLCAYRQPCQYRSPEAFSGFTLLDHMHPELVDDEDNS